MKNFTCGIVFFWLNTEKSMLPGSNLLGMFHISCNQAIKVSCPGVKIAGYSLWGIIVRVHAEIQKMYLVVVQVRVERMKRQGLRMTDFIAAQVAKH